MCLCVIYICVCVCVCDIYLSIYIYIYTHTHTHTHVYGVMIIVIWKWTWQAKFNSWLILFVSHFVFISLGKVWINIFFHQLWVNSMADKATDLRERKTLNSRPKENLWHSGTLFFCYQLIQTVWMVLYTRFHNYKQVTCVSNLMVHIFKLILRALIRHWRLIKRNLYKSLIGIILRWGFLIWELIKKLILKLTPVFFQVLVIIDASLFL